MEETGNTQLNHDHFEDVIIYNILTNDQFFGTIVDHLKNEYFKKDYIKQLLPIFVNFYNQYNKAPKLQEIKVYINNNDQKEAFKYLLGIYGQLRADYNQDELYKNTERFLKEKAVYNTLLSVVDKCTNNEIDTADILQKFEKACGVNLVHDIGLDYFNQIDKVIADLETKENKISCGWKWLDNKLGGGFLQDGRSLYMVAGGTNVGKSIVLGNLAANIANQGKTVLLVSLEMSELMYAKRISTNITQIPFNELALKTKDLREKVTGFRLHHPQSRLIIKEFPPSTITVPQLNSYIIKLVNSGIKPDAIVIDYLTLLHSPLGNTLYEKGKFITEQTRALSYIHKCPIISASQLNREGNTTDNPGLTTLGESMSIGHTADFIMSVWQEEEDKELGLLKFGMMKNRFGPNFGTMSMKINYNTLTLSENEVISDTPESSSVESTIKRLSSNS